MRRGAPLAGFAALFLVLAWLAGQPGALAVDRAVGRALAGLPVPALAGLGIVWAVGALPVTVAAVLAATWHRPGRGYMWAAFAGLILCELACKHFIATPEPPGGAPSWPFVRALDQALNMDPHRVAAWLHGLRPAVGDALALQGGFPSGHVGRLTFLAGVLATRARLRYVAGTALLSALAVVATGGHWLTDAAGGFVLACACLTACRRLRSDAG